MAQKQSTGPITGKEVGFYVGHLLLNSFPSIVAEGAGSVGVGVLTGDFLDNHFQQDDLITFGGGLVAGLVTFGILRGLGTVCFKNSRRLSIHK